MPFSRIEALSRDFISGIFHLMPRRWHFICSRALPRSAISAFRASFSFSRRDRDEGRHHNRSIICIAISFLGTRSKSRPISYFQRAARHAAMRLHVAGILLTSNFPGICHVDIASTYFWGYMTFAEYIIEKFIYAAQHIGIPTYDDAGCRGDIIASRMHYRVRFHFPSHGHGLLTTGRLHGICLPLSALASSMLTSNFLAVFHYFSYIYSRCLRIVSLKSLSIDKPS